MSLDAQNSVHLSPYDSQQVDSKYSTAIDILNNVRIGSIVVEAAKPKLEELEIPLAAEKNKLLSGSNMEGSK